MLRFDDAHCWVESVFVVCLRLKKTENFIRLEKRTRREHRVIRFVAKQLQLTILPLFAAVDKYERKFFLFFLLLKSFDYRIEIQYWW